jgi:hypothetical protein
MCGGPSPFLCFALLRDGTALLYIHRCFFAQAICGHPADPLKSPYAPSFLAAYRSACNILNTLKELADAHPAELARCGDLWTHAFSSAVRISPNLAPSFFTPRCTRSLP